MPKRTIVKSPSTSRGGAKRPGTGIDPADGQDLPTYREPDVAPEPARKAKGGGRSLSGTTASARTPAKPKARLKAGAKAGSKPSRGRR